MLPFWISFDSTSLRFYQWKVFASCKIQSEPFSSLESAAQNDITREKKGQNTNFYFLLFLQSAMNDITTEKRKWKREKRKENDITPEKRKVKTPISRQPCNLTDIEMWFVNHPSIQEKKAKRFVTKTKFQGCGWCWR